MNLHKKTFKTEVGGAEIELEVSEIAGQASAAVLGRWGGTVVLATVVIGKNDAETDYFPLTVDYEERFYAAGKVIGSRFIRREGRPSDEAILSGRLIDRSIRPLFDSRLRREVQIVVTVLAYDEERDPDLISLISVSTALGISPMPWGGPVGVSRFEEKENGGTSVSGFFAGAASKINMIEFEGIEVSESKAKEYFIQAQKEIDKIVSFQEKIISEIGKPKVSLPTVEIDSRLRKTVRDFMRGKLDEAIKEKALGDLERELLENLKNSGEGGGAIKAAKAVFEEEVDSFVRKEVMEKDARPDGRALDEVRELHAETGLFERTHGSAIFIRGTTQVLAVVTLAPPSGEQLVETMETTGKKRFMLHYNFPSFSVGETGRNRGPGRREIGHGTLAAKAVRGLLPEKEEFPYAIRVVAETLSSNGSSSMASACAASLALMDAGVPIKKQVAGIAMGLMTDGKGKYKVLTDIQGPEDHHGDMDLKIAGTKDGITAIQMDVKIEGITQEIFETALSQAKNARLHILETLNKTLSSHRPELSKYAPTILSVKIPVEKIGEVIGPGGRVINKIIAECENKVSIDIEEDGIVFVSSADKALAEKALRTVKDIVREFQAGEVLEGEVVRIMEFGAIVDLGGGKDGMVHVSELAASGFVKKVEDVIRLGQKVRVKVVRVENGRVGLSMKGVEQKKL